MALQLSGPISLSEIATEFGVDAPYMLGDFYAGGAVVSLANVDVPQSGPISFSDFYGAARENGHLENLTVNVTGKSDGVSEVNALIRFQKDGSTVVSAELQGGAVAPGDYATLDSTVPVTPDNWYENAPESGIFRSEYIVDFDFTNYTNISGSRYQVGAFDVSYFAPSQSSLSNSILAFFINPDDGLSGFTHCSPAYTLA